MTIAIDARAYAWTGIGRYILNLLREYAALETTHQFIVLIPEGNLHDFKQRLVLPEDRFSIIEVSGSYYSFAEQTTFLWQLNSIKADLFHFTHFNVPLFFLKSYVVTIHDTTRFIFPGQKNQGFLQQFAYELVFTHAVKSALGVICVSQTTEYELKSLPFGSDIKSSVIYEGISEEFFAEVPGDAKQKARELLGTAAPYFLYVGVWMSHKNLLRLLEAFAAVKKIRPEMKLVITGSPKPSYTKVIERAQELGLKNEVLFPGFVSSELLPALYQEAACFVFPSLYEGFGLPPLEAAAQGVPVVTSNVSSMPEIMKEAAVYVNPEDANDIAAGMIKALEPLVRAHLAVEGKKRAKVFSWKTCAQETLGVYEQV